MDNLLVMPTRKEAARENNREWKAQAEEAVIITETAPKKFKEQPFVEANTIEVTLNHLRNECIIPVYSKDNEVSISHQAFIETIWEACKDFYRGETIEFPRIRVSHIVKGRIPSAINKPVSELLESDKTQYYSRMIFNIYIPTIYQDVCGNQLELSVCGCKSYNRDNLAGKLTAQKFSLAVGFKNLACTNQCISTDGYRDEIRASSTTDLYSQALDLIGHYNLAKHIHLMQSLGDTYLTEKQFCQILGRMRLYNYLPQSKQRELPNLLITDSQINNVARQYLYDENFAGSGNGEISMWKFYNLLTGANKNSYLDTFLGRSVNATETAYGITQALQQKDDSYSWFLE